jgi:TorA maturation chaperone TorD
MFASLALQPPSGATLDAMRCLLPSMPADLRTTAAGILESPLDEWEPEFFSVLGPSGCPACESSYERAAMASRGPLLADIAAYYQAFAYRPEGLREVPDHVAVELDFLSFMAVKIAFANFEARNDEAAVARDAYEAFHRRHLDVWAPALCDALVETGSPQYQSVARFLQTLIVRKDPACGSC